jgi:hypothetical protein
MLIPPKLSFWNICHAKFESRAYCVNHLSQITDIPLTALLTLEGPSLVSFNEMKTHLLPTQYISVELLWGYPTRRNLPRGHAGVPMILPHQLVY